MSEPRPAPTDAIMTALQLQHSNLQTNSALVSAGADLNATDSEGKTACDWAELFKRDEAIRNLVCEGRCSFDLNGESPNPPAITTRLRLSCR